MHNSAMADLISSYRTYTGPGGIEIEAGSGAPASTPVCASSAAFFASYTFFDTTCDDTGC